VSRVKAGECSLPLRALDDDGSDIAPSRCVTALPLRAEWSGELGDSLLVSGNRFFEPLAEPRANHAQALADQAC
jgi:hypothetical protein